MERSKHGDLVHVSKTPVHLALQDTKENEIVLWKGSITNRFDSKASGVWTGHVCNPRGTSLRRGLESLSTTTSFDGGNQLTDAEWKRGIENAI